MDSHDVRRRWTERSGEYSPEYYAYYGPDGTSDSLFDTLDRYVGRDADVLELGCSSGRHLSRLVDGGFENVTGVELNGDAIDVLAETYPELAERGTFHVDAIENVVGDVADDAFDAVYSVETLQHVHPDSAWVFEEIARITGDVLVTVENEGDVDDDADVNYVDDGVPLYYRDWEGIFTEFDLTQVDVESRKRDTMRTFRVE